MIIRSRLDFRRLARTLGLPLALLLCLSSTVTATYKLGWRWIAIDDLALPLLGSAIAIIVTFRNNAAYNRWWEARTLWGQIVNNSRALARTTITFLDDAAVQSRLIRCQIAHVLALRGLLLAQPAWNDIAPYVRAELLTELKRSTNVPNAIHAAVGRELSAARHAARLDAIGATAIDTALSALANAQGGLERIKRTPLPRQYVQFPQIVVLLYSVLLPFGMIEDLGYVTIFAAPIVGLMFLALDKIGRDLEDPFEGSEHDTPMRAICRTIEIDLLQMLGLDQVPEPVKPVDGVLW